MLAGGGVPEQIFQSFAALMMPSDRAHPDEYFDGSDDSGPTSVAGMAATGSFFRFSGSTLIHCYSWISEIKGSMYQVVMFANFLDGQRNRGEGLTAKQIS